MFRFVNKKAIPVLLVLFVAMATGSCKKKPETEPMKPKKISKRIISSDFKFDLSKSPSQKCRFISRFEINAADMDSILPVKTAMLMDWQAKGREEITMGIEKIEVQAGGMLHDDLTQPINEEQPEVTVALGDKGEINSISGLEEPLGKMDGQAGRDRDKKAIAAVVRRQLSLMSLQNAMGALYGFTPSAPQKEGAEWAGNPMNVSLLGSNEVAGVNIKYKFQSMDAGDKNLARILFGGETSFGADEFELGDALAGMISVGRAKATLNSVKVKGYVVFNIKSKEIEEIKQEISFNTKVATKTDESDIVLTQTSIMDLKPGGNSAGANTAEDKKTP